MRKSTKINIAILLAIGLLAFMPLAACKSNNGSATQPTLSPLLIAQQSLGSAEKLDRDVSDLGISLHKDNVFVGTAWLDFNKQMGIAESQLRLAHKLIAEQSSDVSTVQKYIDDATMILQDYDRTTAAIKKAPTTQPMH